MESMDPLLPPNFRVRPAVPEDLTGMARVHVETWKTTYREMVPDDRLDALTVEGDIAGGFGRWLRSPPEDVAQFVAERGPEGIVGFALGGPNREPDPAFLGELGAIYVRKSQQGRGVGRALVGAVARHLVRIERPSTIVWVLAQNPYRRFYERLGGIHVRERIGQSRLAGAVPEVSYGWTDVRGLARL
ncbi:MAG: GNAT family N-acetyltransferase [Thermoplasmata archaeon]